MFRVDLGRTLNKARMFGGGRQQGCRLPKDEPERSVTFEPFDEARHAAQPTEVGAKIAIPEPRE